MGCVSSSPSVKIPWTLSSLTRYEWKEWRKCFLTFMEHKYIPPYKQTNKFFKYIGFLGEEIANDYLYFYETKSETNFKTVLFKFDVYFLFTGVMKLNHQSIEEYIFLLKSVAEQAGNNDSIEKVVKEKILQDFKSNNIFNQIKNRMLTPSVINYETLSLHELIFLWNECDKSVEMVQHLLYIQNRKNKAQCLPSNSCLSCGQKHQQKQCYAKGKKCYNCGELNHYAKCCSKTYITDCDNCGSSHAQRQCPALGKKCSKCQEMNHFSWKCCKKIIQSCIFCGKSHINNRQKCIAHDKRCSSCHKMGHFANMCQT